GAPGAPAGRGAALEGLQRVVERLARRLRVVRLLAPAAQPVVLLGDVRELEVEAERTQHERGVRGSVRPRAGDVAAPARGARGKPNLLDRVEQLLADLLDEDGAEDRPEEPDVAAEQLVARAHTASVGATRAATATTSPMTISAGWGSPSASAASSPSEPDAHSPSGRVPRAITA